MKKNKVLKKARRKLKKVKKETSGFILKVRKNIATAIIAAFAFVMALVWRDAIKDGVSKIVQFLGIPNEGYLFTIIAAVLVTLFCVIGIILFSRWAEKK